MEYPNHNLQQWFHEVPGTLLLEAEAQVLSHLLPKLFGYHLLQIGGAGDADWLKDCRIPHRIHISASCPCHFKGSCLLGNFEELPFAPDSIDVILLPHVLEFSQQPMQILQESYSVLIPGGHIVILGFHPWSLWGIKKLFNLDKTSGPWQGHFYSSYRIRTWLAQQGFNVERHQTLFFRPPLRNPQWLDKLTFLEAMGPLVWPYLGGVYLIVAQKRIASLTPLKYRFRYKKIRLPQGVPQPTARVES